MTRARRRPYANHTKKNDKSPKVLTFGPFVFGAVEKTRTSTGVSPQRPQRCASTNSATAARLRCPLYVTFILIYQACFAAQGEKVKKPAHQPFRPSALSRRPFAHHLSRRPFRAAAPESNIPESHIPKATYPKRQYRRETIASQQKAGYAIATINDGLLPTGS